MESFLACSQMLESYRVTGYVGGGFIGAARVPSTPSARSPPGPAEGDVDVNSAAPPGRVCPGETYRRSEASVQAHTDAQGARAQREVPVPGRPGGSPRAEPGCVPELQALSSLHSWNERW